MRRRLSPSLYYATPGHLGGENGTGCRLCDARFSGQWPSLPAASIPPRSAARATRRTAAAGRGGRMRSVISPAELLDEVPDQQGNVFLERRFFEMHAEQSGKSLLGRLLYPFQH